MIMRYLFYAFLIYLAYRLVFHLIIPIYKTTKQVKRQFRDMSGRMNQPGGQEQADARQSYQQTSASRPETRTAKAGDYIDFEEVKK